MSNYHTQALAEADIFMIMGSIYAEVARYDSAVMGGQKDLAQQAVVRAQEIIDFAQQLRQVKQAQKQEIAVFRDTFLSRVQIAEKSELDDYLLPFAIAARKRQFS